MKKIAVLLFVSFFAMLVAFILVLKQNGGQTPAENKTVSAQKTFQKQVNKQGDVSVEVTPLSLLRGKEASFSVVFDTHSVNLDYDIASLAAIFDEKGQSYKAVAWTGGRGGHHLSGELRFPPLPTFISKVTLVVFNIDTTDRQFVWSL